MKYFVKSLKCFSLVTVLFVLSGCRSVEMKGTPFYTGEYRKRNGPAEDRIQFWPLLYYRDPALSVLWPVGEFTDEHWAVRPLMSVYGLGSGKEVYNFLWPLAQYDSRNEDARIFPVFWGKNHAGVFPLYWHVRDGANSEYFTDTLFPVWWYDRDSRGLDLFMPWPLIRYKNRGSDYGGHVFPLFGSYHDSNSSYGFYAWPLGHTWSGPAAGSYGSALLPAYWYSKEGQETTFLSLPYSFSEDTAGHGWSLMVPLMYRSENEQNFKTLTPLYSWGGSTDSNSSWNLLLPLYYSSRSGSDRFVGSLLGGYSSDRDGYGWLALPLLSGASIGKSGGSAWYPWPLAHSTWNADGGSHFFLPFYANWRNSSGSAFVSLPWTSVSGNDGTAWQLVPPLFYSGTNRNGSLLLTPLYSGGSSLTGDHWNMVLPLFYESKTKSGSKVVTPLYSRGESADGKKTWSLLSPLYYSSESGDERFFGTILGGYEKDAGGYGWMALPLLSGGLVGPDSGSTWYPWPLAHSTWTKDSSLHFLLPLYAYSGSPAGHSFYSLPWSSGSRSDGSFWQLLPPVFFRSAGEHESKLITPLYSRGESEDGRNSWKLCLPLFYQAAKGDETVVATLLGGYKSDHDSYGWLALPLFGGSGDRNGNSAWYPWPLAHAEWGPEAHSSFVFPLYGYSSDGYGYSFCSLPWSFGSYTDGSSWKLLPPLFYSHSDKTSSMFLTPLYSRGRGEGNSEADWDCVLPLFVNSRKGFFTPVIGWNNDKVDSYVYPLTPLLGMRTGDRYGGGWLFPLVDWKSDKVEDSTKVRIIWGGYEDNANRTESGFFPLFGYKNYKEPATHPGHGTYGSDFWCLPVCWYVNQKNVYSSRASTNSQPVIIERTVNKNGFFPVWSYSANEVPATGSKKIDGDFLWFLYDYHREVKATGTNAVANSDYRRARVLWHLWHYENSDGDVSVDAFPAITYDSKQDGYSKFSFLWRFIRYERRNGALNMDFLYIPIWRGSVADKAAVENRE